MHFWGVGIAWFGLLLYSWLLSSILYPCIVHLFWVGLYHLITISLPLYIYAMTPSVFHRNYSFDERKYLVSSLILFKDFKSVITWEIICPWGLIFLLNFFKTLLKHSSTIRVKIFSSGRWWIILSHVHIVCEPPFTQDKSFWHIYLQPRKIKMSNVRPTVGKNPKLLVYLSTLYHVSSKYNSS